MNMVFYIAVAVRQLNSTFPVKHSVDGKFGQKAILRQEIISTDIDCL